MKERYLGRKLGAETLADENGVAVHEIVKAVVNTVYEQGFHGCPLRFAEERGREGEEEKEKKLFF